jgi:4-amino-4-deoxy-L-arabinose transferase-like glycosyltransferase
MISKKNISKVYFLFLFFHLALWTLIPSISNINLPLDTIEALAWGSNLDWGFDKHPPFSALAAEIFYNIFGSNDWAYYFLSQVFVIISFIYVWKLSNEIFEDKIYSLVSLFVLSGILFFNFTTPEFNVNISQLPFWALTVYYFWKSINTNKKVYWILFAIFSALGFLSKYLFIYI